MAFIRITHNNFEHTYNAFRGDTFNENEWDDAERVDEDSWISRYNYEDDLVSKYIENYDCNTIL